MLVEDFYILLYIRVCTYIYNRDLIEKKERMYKGIQKNKPTKGVLNFMKGLQSKRL